MTHEKRWPNLQYELAQSGGRISRKYWTRPTLRAGAYVGVLILLALCCLGGAYVLWFTNFINNTMQSVLMYRDGGSFLADWQYPKYTPITKVYVYNYTNTEAFLRGEAHKLRVEEVGPFTYSEKLEKVNIQFHEDSSTLSYREKRIFTFLPDQSAAAEDDTVIVPNIPLISAMSIVRDKGFTAQLGLRSALWALNLEKGAFDRLRARDYLFGYADKLHDVAQSALEVVGGKLPKLGILASRNGVSDTVYTIHSGAGNYSLVDVVEAVNGRPNLGAWSEADCNRIDGSVGALFYPEPLKTRSRLHLFHVDLCRRIDLDFEEELMVMGDIPAYRYAPPAAMFENADDNPENACYSLPSYARWPSGVFLNAPCFSDSPVFVSYPRFFQGDPRLRQMVEGVPEPERDKHQFYVDVHPEMGVTMGVGVRFQANVMVRKAPLVGEYLDRFQDNIILPSLWFETIIAGYDESGRRRTWHATYTLRWAEAGLQWALPMAAVALALLAGRRLWRCAQCRPQEPLPHDGRQMDVLAELKDPLSPD